jgi:hypothetical protein
VEVSVPAIEVLAMLNWLFAAMFAVMPSCVVEDDNNCKWDATVQGNGEGTSFIVVLDNVFVMETK